jgi:hypothetical protein
MPNIALDGTPYDISRVRSVMLFPNDDSRRDQYFAVERARLDVLEAKDAEHISLEVNTLRLLIDAPAYSVIKAGARDITKRAVVAGELLSILYLMNRFELSEPSMNKAIFVAQGFAKESSYGDGSKINSSERMIRKYWNEFKPVAHLWAAFRINRAYGFAPIKEVFTKEWFTPFLSVAAGLYNFGTQFVPFRPRDKKPMLNAETCWALPKSIPPSNLSTDRIPDKLIQTLERYNAPRAIT